jgi:hypothetical protein
MAYGPQVPERDRDRARDRDRERERETERQRDRDRDRDRAIDRPRDLSSRPSLPPTSKLWPTGPRYQRETEPKAEPETDIVRER